MTKKDYIAIAKILADDKQRLLLTIKDTYMLGASIITLEHIRDRIITYMQSENTNFDKDKFMAACNKE